MDAYGRDSNRQYENKSDGGSERTDSKLSSKSSSSETKFGSGLGSFFRLGRKGRTRLPIPKALLGRNDAVDDGETDHAGDYPPPRHAFELIRPTPSSPPSLSSINASDHSSHNHPSPPSLPSSSTTFQDIGTHPPFYVRLNVPSHLSLGEIDLAAASECDKIKKKTLRWLGHPEAKEMMKDAAWRIWMGEQSSLEEAMGAG
jgi:hypothetical protein